MSGNQAMFNRRMSHQRRTLFLVSALILAATLAWAGLPVGAEQPIAAAAPQVEPQLSQFSPSVFINPAALIVKKNDQFTLAVQIINVRYLYAYQWEIAFNPAILQVVDANAGEPGVQIEPAAVFQGLGPFTQCTVSNAAGTIRCESTLLAPADPVTWGYSHLGQIRFKAVGSAKTMVEFSSAQCHLAERDADPIVATWRSGSVLFSGGVVRLPLVMRSR